MEKLQISTNEMNGWHILSLSGSLDRMTSEETGKRGEELQQDIEKIAMDLSGLEYISSAGIRVLLKLAKKAKADGKKYAICGATGFVKEVLEDANMDVLVDMFDSTDQLS
ncbi:hypothetical protein D081_1617 [Anaerovibrio sp. JC8]|uniref:STAS domain-containing protein n=1 Tax=Anaerovibrio sp. JC8 TaxID=1240085 RepID=UPI000A0BCD41|nr:STAS domain-containing protein [Anaerovibrio sp. JC8]ORT99733.1 hypothetical protein D081_1617 [Anaerovibrio sp. JC8]